MKEFDPTTEFQFDSKRYKYFDHEINETINNERAVEIPIVTAKMRKVQPEEAEILEVGDVLWQYGFERPRRIIDLGSKREGVEMIDALMVKDKYDFIASISSIEHVGIDINNGDVFRCAAVVNHLCNLLKPGGHLIFTIPVGYNRVLDEWLQAAWPGTIRFLLRVTRSGQWVSTDRVMLRNVRYGYPFKSGNAVMVCEYGVPAK